jgi:hypothetical protein
MKLYGRFFLVFAALLCIIEMGTIGIEMSQALEEELTGPFDFAFWYLFATLFVFPMWFPAVLPGSDPKTFRTAKRVCSALLFFPLIMFSSIVIHKIDFAERGEKLMSPEFLFSSFETVAC